MKDNEYAVQWTIQWGSKPSDLMDRCFTSLHKAREYQAKWPWNRDRPIYCHVWDLESETLRYIPGDELCQCCETKLAKMILDKAS